MNKYYITGSSKGIGRGLVDSLLKKENNLITGISRTNDIDHERFDHVKMDLSDTETLAQEADRLFTLDQSFDQIILINNAGYLGEIKYLGDIPDRDFYKAYSINITAPAVLMNAFIRNFKDNKAAKKIINISSGAAQNAYDGWSEYCSSKAAIDMLSRVADMEREKRGYDITVVSLAPGVIETGMQEQIRSTSERDFSNVGRFHSLKENDQLLSTDEAAEKIIRFIEQIRPGQETVVDLRG